MIFMRQIHGSALWTEITMSEFYDYLRDENYSPAISKNGTMLASLGKGDIVETEVANYARIADATELDKKIQSKCTEIILSLMDNNKWSEIEAKEHLVGLLDSKLTYFKYPTI